MKKFTRTVASTISFWLICQVFANSQNVAIIGPTSLCFGECGTYELVSFDSLDVVQVVWFSNNGVVFGSSNPVVICADQANGFVITAFGYTSNQDSVFAETFVEVTTSVNPIIISTSATCPQDSSGSNACDKICAFGTGVYEVAGVPASSPVTWQVQGAENYTVNGNTVTVDWGPPGQGQVTASVGGGTWTPPLQVFCGQLNIDPNNPGTGVGGDGYVTAFGGVLPYSYVNPASLNNMIVGSYTALVVDAAGTSATCQFNITNNFQDCWFSVNPVNIKHSSACGVCDGAISIQPIGGISTAYSFLWNNGSTTQNLTGLCPGFYAVTITDNQGCSTAETFQIDCPDNICSGTSTLCVEILEEPRAAIASQPPAIAGTIEICQGQTVYFENNSTNATSYIWDFGDLNTSTQFEPGHTFPTPGTYTVSLIARNECYCSDTTFITVNVLAADVPIINCTGTVCEGETVTYSTDASCGTYNWGVTGGGVILGGGGPGDNFITAEWPVGPEGTVSLDVSGCAGSVCNLPNVVPIPIISDNVQIQGPNKVCEGSTEEYFIPNYQGTEINWTVQGSGNIVDGQGSERITVNWYGNANIGNPQRVIVEFQNCYLGCGGKDTLLVNIVPSFYVKGPIEICESTTGTFQSRNTLNDNLMNSNWEVFDVSGASVWASAAATNTANISFTFPPGSYTVQAKPANASSFCNNRYDVFVKLVAAPPPPTGIAGPLEICPGETYSYDAQGLPTSDFSWTFTGGTPAVFNGNPANVVWGATPPYIVSVVQIATTGLACASPPYDLNVDPLPNFTITGDGQVCLENQGNYSVPFFEVVEYQWTISPPGAGTIVAGQGTESIGVLWHSVGPATVNVAVCGFTQNFNVNVLALPEPVAQHPASICQGETATVQTTVPYASYVWNNASGSQISTLPSPMLGGGNFEVEVTDANGCVGDTIFEIIEHELPPVSISLPAYLPICPGGPSATIFSVTTGAGGYTYQWFRDGSPFGGNTADLVTNQAGNYWLVVTDANGCTASSSTKTVLDCAAMGGTCVGGTCVIPAGGCPDCTLCNCIPLGGCQSNGNIDFTFAQAADCDQIDFTNSSTNFIPGSFNWNFGDPASGASNTSTLANPSHVYSDVGHFTVLLTGLVQDLNNPGSGCFDYVYYNVIVPLKANFESSPACPNAPVEFIDRSIFVTGASITGWTWDFGDPGSGAANTSSLQDPTHIYNVPGSYPVTLTLTEASGCQVSFTKNITVFTPPSVNFALPTLTCENAALPFNAIVPANVASVYWEFGEPSSGDGNSSELVNSFHEFDAPGPYTVTLTALSVEGCTNSFSDVMTVTPNTLGGMIGYSQPSPICEGDQITLTAPPGGIAWDWASGEATVGITVFESGSYDVTITSAEGCTYSPPAAPVDVFGEPNGIIKAVEYNEFGQPVAFFENNYTVCEGEDVNLIVQGTLNYSYVWSNGEPGGNISFTAIKGNLLAVGTHNFTVTVTDNTSGCTSEEGPFTVTVNPVPSVQIASSPAGFLCENNSAVLNVVGPNPLLTYGWNTGEIGNSITVIAGGTYFVQAVNQFGCKGRSNEITIFNAPDIDLVPTGCHARCNPDTMCLPNVPAIASYQWFLNGSPISAPNGTLTNPIFTQSGEYSVEMTDIYGCTSMSGVLSLDLFPGFGDILGNVYFDVNGNGIIDGPDTLVSGINIFLNDGSVNLDTVTSNTGGSYIFVDILSSNYTVVLDTANLPTGWQAVFVNSLIDLVGCDVEEQFDWLLTVACVSTIETVEMEACIGDGVIFDGVFVPAGSSQDFVYTNAEGCDSTITLTVNPLPTATSAVDFDACPGDGIVFDGTFVPAGSVQDFFYPNANGCDSVVTVTVNPFPNFTTPLELQACAGTTVIYEGVTLSPGDQQDFVLTDQNGCDSIVQVSVAELPVNAEPLQLSTCPNTFVSYQGVQLAPGDVQDFTFQNQFGCDSVVTVSVTALPVVTTQLSLPVCENETIVYEGVELSPGDQQDFVLADQNGCDSVVQVSVVGLPTNSGQLQLMACPGATITYQGQTLSIGDQQDFIFQNLNGCDSIVSVTVAPAPVDVVSLAFQVCEGETLEFNGQQLSPGDQQDFVLQNQFGCDSTVQVSVSSFPSVSYDLKADKICWNETNGSIEVMSVSGSTPPYLFSLDGTVFQADPVFEGLTGGSYTVFLQDANDCVFEEQIAIPTVAPILVETTDESLVCGDSVRLSPLAVSELPLSWLWQNGLSSDKIWVKSPGTYTFQVSNDCEIVEKAVTVTLDESGPASRIYMPNSFSPNGDGINDCYKGYVSPSVNLQFFVLKIFDRWGDMMFETNDPEVCWDGWFKGKPMDPAVFVWFIEMQALNCDGSILEIFREGDIHLVK
ncbi:MAG: PKD domain-containing protein [Saprospiraceae bacterium]